MKCTSYTLASVPLFTPDIMNYNVGISQKAQCQNKSITSWDDLEQIDNLWDEIGPFAKTNLDLGQAELATKLMHWIDVN